MFDVANWLDRRIKMLKLEEPLRHRLRDDEIIGLFGLGEEARKKFNTVPWENRNWMVVAMKFWKMPMGKRDDYLFKLAYGAQALYVSKAIEHMGNHGPITSKQLAELLKISIRTAQTALRAAGELTGMMWKVPGTMARLFDYVVDIEPFLAALHSLLSRTTEDLVFNLDETQVRLGTDRKTKSMWGEFFPADEPGSLGREVADFEPVAVDPRSKVMMMSLLVAVSMSGRKVPKPMVATKRKLVAVDDVHQDDTTWKHSESGWITTEMFFQFLTDLFDHIKVRREETAPKSGVLYETGTTTPKQPAVVILDRASTRNGLLGRTSSKHTKLRATVDRLKQRMREENIHLVFVPAGATQYFQPLDCSVFAWLKRHAKGRTSEENVTSTNPMDLIRSFQEAWFFLSSSTIQAAWRNAGLSPWDPERVMSAMLWRKGKSPQREGDGLTTAGSVRCGKRKAKFRPCLDRGSDRDDRPNSSVQPKRRV